MPVTIRPQPEQVGVNSDYVATSSADLLRQTSKAWIVDQKELRGGLNTNKKIGTEDRPVLRSSFGDLDNTPHLDTPSLVPYGNGFVDGVLRAFQQDLHLTLRPDDVWLAILTQFSFYVNGRAEELRGTFVKHDGKEKIVVNMMPATLESIDMNVFCERVVAALRGVIIDKGLTDWLLPEFSTTTDNDRTVASVVVMATMKSYFEYVMMIGCGFPSVTLEGEREDWVKLRERVGRLAQYGDEPAEWSTYLDKALEKMVWSFDAPTDEGVESFWMRACHAAGVNGSVDTETLSGWLTAFCFWDEDGKKISSFSDERLEAMWTPSAERKRLILDDVAFPIISRKAIPKAVSDVPLLVEDAGTGLRYHTTLIAGSTGVEGTKGTADEKAGIVGFKPRSGWWLLLDKTEPL